MATAVGQAPDSKLDGALILRHASGHLWCRTPGDIKVALALLHMADFIEKGEPAPEKWMKVLRGDE